MSRRGPGVLLLSLVVLALASSSALAQARKWVEVVKYGPHPRQVFIIWHSRVGGNVPKPVYVNFFGGAFAFGGPNGGPFIGSLLQQGVTVVGGGYRFTQDQSTKREIMEDGARVVQYLRAHAAKYYVDPRHVGVGGFSSGGVVASWIALHADLANPASPDPVLRESSRVSVCCLQGAQVHPLTLEDWVRYTGGNVAALQLGIVQYVLTRLNGSRFRNPILRSNYPSDAAYQQALEAYKRDTFGFYLGTADDPPTCFLENNVDDPNRYVSLANGGGLHSPLLMIPLQRKLKDLRVEVQWGGVIKCRTFILAKLKPAT